MNRLKLIRQLKLLENATEVWTDLADLHVPTIRYRHMIFGKHGLVIEKLELLS